MITGAGVKKFLPERDGLKNNPTWLPVVAVALQRGAGLWLMHRRPEGKHHAGLWEFPGGKVEPGETPAQAAVREIGEELGIELAEADLKPAAFAQESTQVAGKTIVILLYTCARWRGTPQPIEGGAVGWFSLQDAEDLPKPPLDITLLAGLRNIAGH